MDGKKENFWASEMGEDIVDFTIMFEGGIKTINQIKIDWAL